MIPSKLTMVILNLIFSALFIYFIASYPLDFELMGLGVIIYGAILMGIANAVFIFKIPGAQIKEMKRREINAEIKKRQREIQSLEKKAG